MYERNKAVDYAINWALKRNPNYYNFNSLGGDCTNFISQCLYSGNIKFNYNNKGWFYHSLYSRTPSWTGVDELFDFAMNNYELNGPKFNLVSINDIEIGDIIQLNVNRLWTHSLIVTNIGYFKSYNSIFICSHSKDSLNRALSTYKFNAIRFCKVLN